MASRPHSGAEEKKSVAWAARAFRGASARLPLFGGGTIPSLGRSDERGRELDLRSSMSGKSWGDDGSASERRPLLRQPEPEMDRGNIQGLAGPSAPDHSALLDVESSPAYASLVKNDLLVTKYQVQSDADIVARPPNSSPEKNACVNGVTCVCFPCFCCIKGWIKQFTVDQGTLRMVTDGRGGYEFCSAGVHQYKSPWLSVLPESKSIQGSGDGRGTIIQHGDRFITTVPQGFVGYAEDNGEPVLLPPGMHQWQSPTRKSDAFSSLRKPFARLG